MIKQLYIIKYGNAIIIAVIKEKENCDVTLSYEWVAKRYYLRKRLNLF